MLVFIYQPSTKHLNTNKKKLTQLNKSKKFKIKTEKIGSDVCIAKSEGFSDNTNLVNAVMDADKLTIIIR